MKQAAIVREVQGALAMLERVSYDPAHRFIVSTTDTGPVSPAEAIGYVTATLRLLYRDLTGEGHLPSSASARDDARAVTR